MGWSKKYKRSIDCNNPKGFSQKAHCAGRKKRESVMKYCRHDECAKVAEHFYVMSEDKDEPKRDACYHKVKARYKVWPSAYASGALVSCRQVGAKNWGNKSKKEGVNEAYGLSFGDFFDYATKDREKVDFLKKIKKSKPKVFQVLKAKDKEAKKILNKYSKMFEEGVNEAGMELNKLKDAIKMFQKKIEKQGRVTNARDEEHLSNLIKLYKQMGGKGVKEGLDNLKDTIKNLRKNVDKKEEGFASAAQRRAAFASGYKAKGKKKKKESVDEARGTCWVGYQQLGMKRKGGKMVPNCVKEITELYYEIDGKGYGYTFEYINDGKLNEAEYQGRKVKLGKPTAGDVKKFKVYVKNPQGNVVKVNFGHKGKGGEKTMRIKKSNPERRKSFRARHNCDNPGPRHKARYWSCRKW